MPSYFLNFFANDVFVGVTPITLTSNLNCWETWVNERRKNSSCCLSFSQKPAYQYRKNFVQRSCPYIKIIVYKSGYKRDSKYFHWNDDGKYWTAFLEKEGGDERHFRGKFRGKIY